MKQKIDVQVQQLIRACAKRYQTSHGNAAELMSDAAKQLYPNMDMVTTWMMGCENAVEETIKKMEREAAAAESEFHHCAQLSLLGELIPEHKVPKAMLVKSAAEVDEWMTERAGIERDNAVEMRRAAEAQDRKAQRFEQWQQAVHAVCEALSESGFDPQEVTYAEALRKAEAYKPGESVVPGAQAARALR